VEDTNSTRRENDMAQAVDAPRQSSWPVTKLDRETQARDAEDYEARRKARTAVLEYLQSLGQDALNGVPVYVITREVPRIDPSISRFTVRMAVDALEGSGELISDRVHDTVRPAQ
jgi:hypothetical protein